MELAGPVEGLGPSRHWLDGLMIVDYGAVRQPLYDNKASFVADKSLEILIV
jgi:hypothetical protein